MASSAECWGEEETQQLLDNVLSVSGSFTRSFQHGQAVLNWEQLKTDGRSAEDCKEKFAQLTKKVRKFRLMKEIVGDAKELANFPKKPPSAYTMFLTKRFKKHFKQGGTFKTASSVTSDDWKKLTQRKRAKYTRKSQELHDQYKIDLEEFMEHHPDIAVQKPEPPVPVQLYIRSQIVKCRAKHVELNIAEAKTRLQDKYEKLSNKKKLKYIYKAQSKLCIYSRQCDSYKLQHDNVHLKPVKVVLSKTEQQILDIAQGKPSTIPAKNLINYYFSIKTDSGQAASDKLQPNRGYNALTKEEKKMLTEQYEQTVHSYAEEYAQYFDILTAETKLHTKTVQETLEPYQKILEPKAKKKKASANENHNFKAQDSDSSDNKQNFKAALPKRPSFKVIWSGTTKTTHESSKRTTKKPPKKNKTVHVSELVEDTVEQNITSPKKSGKTKKTQSASESTVDKEVEQFVSPKKSKKCSSIVDNNDPTAGMTTPKKRSSKRRISDNGLDASVNNVTRNVQNLDAEDTHSKKVKLDSDEGSEQDHLLNMWA